MSKCKTTHHACDCQIEWRREAERLLRGWLATDPHGAGYCHWESDRCLRVRVRLLLGEDKPDG